MNKAEAVAYIQAQTVCAMAEIEAMKAENHWCEKSSQSLTYTPQDFRAVCDHYGIHHNAVLTTFGEAT